jgi:hypothetical protein
MTGQTQPSANRPLGITILALLQILLGLFGICLPTFFLIAGTAGLFLGPVGAALGGAGICIGLLLIAGPVLHLIVGFGALNLHKWAWWLGILATGVDVLAVILNLWNGAGVLAAILPAIFSVLVFIYLLMPGVRKAFQI